jgi:hypothetical protein
MESEEINDDTEHPLMNIEIDETQNENYEECINITSVFRSMNNLNK